MAHVYVRRVKGGRYQFLECSVRDAGRPEGRFRFRLGPANHPDAQALGAELTGMSDADILSALPEIHDRLGRMPWRQRRPLTAARVKITTVRRGGREFLDAQVNCDGRHVWARRLGPSSDPKVQVVAERLAGWTGQQAVTSEALEKELRRLHRQHYKTANHRNHMPDSMAAGRRAWKNRFGTLGLYRGGEITFGSMDSDLLDKLAGAEEIRNPHRAEGEEVRKLLARTLFERLVRERLAQARAVWKEVIYQGVGIHSRAGMAGIARLRELAGHDERQAREGRAGGAGRTGDPNLNGGGPPAVTEINP